MVGGEAAGAGGHAQTLTLPAFGSKMAASSYDDAHNAYMSQLAPPDYGSAADAYYDASRESGRAFANVMHPDNEEDELERFLG